MTGGVTSAGGGPVGSDVCRGGGQASWTVASVARLAVNTGESPPHECLGCSPAAATGSPVAALGPADPGPLSGSAAASVRQKQNPCIMNKFHVQHFKCLFMSPDN